MNVFSLKKNVIIFGMRQVLLLTLSFFVNIYMTKKMASYDFGRLVIFNATLAAFSVFSDGGLFIGFIQRKEDISHDRMNQMFSFQIIVLLIVLLLCLILSTFKVWDYIGIDYVYATYIVVVLNSIQSIYYVKFQKDLNVSIIALCDITSSIAYYIVVVILLFLGKGLTSVIIATIIKALIGSIFAWFNFPIKIKLINFTRDKMFLRSIWNGVINQISYVIGVVRSLLNPVIVGYAVGTSAVGLVDRAVFFSGVPNGIVAIIAQRVLFPYFSKNKDDTRSLQKKIKDSCFLAAFFDKLYYMPLILLIDSMVGKYLGNEWIDLLPLVYILSVGNMLFSSVSAVSNSVLLSLGKYSAYTILNIIQLLLSWPIAIILASKYGVIGYIWISPIMWLFTFPTIVIIRRELIELRIIYEVIFPTLLAGITILVVQLLREFLFIKDIVVEIIAFTFLEYFVYFLLAIILEKKYLPEIIWRITHKK